MLKGTTKSHCFPEDFFFLDLTLWKAISKFDAIPNKVTATFLIEIQEVKIHMKALRMPDKQSKPDQR